MSRDRSAQASLRPVLPRTTIAEGVGVVNTMTTVGFLSYHTMVLPIFDKPTCARLASSAEGRKGPPPLELEAYVDVRGTGPHEGCAIVGPRTGTRHVHRWGADVRSLRAPGGPRVRRRLDGPGRRQTSHLHQPAPAARQCLCHVQERARRLSARLQRRLEPECRPNRACDLGADASAVCRQRRYLPLSLRHSLYGRGRQ